MYRVVALLKTNGVLVGYRLLNEWTVEYKDCTMQEAYDIYKEYGFTHADIRDGELICRDGDVGRLPVIDTETGECVANDFVIILNELHNRARLVGYTITDYTYGILNVTEKELTDYIPVGFYNATVTVKKGHRVKGLYRRISVEYLGCPPPKVCSRTIVPVAESVHFARSDLLPLWDYVKNGSMRPYHISNSFPNRVHLICTKGHPYRVYTSASSCPYCTNRLLLTGYNDLATLRPDIAKDWNTVKNNGAKPSDYVAGSRVKVWWLCHCGEEWKTSISQRTMGGTGCPNCCHQGTSYKEFSLLYYLIEMFGDVKHRYKLNGVEVDLYVPSIGMVIEYDGSHWHAGKESKDRRKNSRLKEYLFVRVRENGLSYLPDDNCIQIFVSRSEKGIAEAVERIQCILKDRGVLFNPVGVDTSKDRALINNLRKLKEVDNSVASLYPHLVEEWHPTRNGKFTLFNVTPGSEIKFVWKCKNYEDHEWVASVTHRVDGQGCAVCASKQILVGFNDFATTHPDLLSEWDYEKNVWISPHDITYGSRIKVFWKCSSNSSHSWEAEIKSRAVNKSGCPFCANARVLKGYNDLESVHPKIAEDWDYTENELLPSEVLSGTNRKVYWLCVNGTEAYSSVRSRVMVGGCRCKLCGRSS